MHHVIKIEGLRKEYGSIVAVEGVSLAVQAGQIYGLLGPNGAGKSSTIGCLSGLLKPSAGRVEVLGHDVLHEALASRRSLGIVPQELALYMDLSASENLRFWGAAYGLRGRALGQRVTEVLERVGLAERANDACKKFSGGMQRRLNFACGVIHRPKVLLLDEPTVGVDPQSRVRLLEMVREEAQSGTCVLYTTHYMEEAEGLCDRIGIIDHGKLIAEGSLSELHEQMGQRDLLRLQGSFEPEPVRQALELAFGNDEGYELVQMEASSLVLALPQASKRLPRVFGVLADCGGDVRETTLSKPSLESLFIKLTGKELRE